MPQQFANNPLGSPFIELQSIDSTNNYALAQIHAGLAHHGHAFFAYEQVAGKGQRGRTWVSEPGSNIILSLVVNPDPLAIHDQFQLSACVAVALKNFFSGFAPEYTRIKWPNDLYWQDRKAGGVLIENVIGIKKSNGDNSPTHVDSIPHLAAPDRSWRFAVIGIGLNINQTSFAPELRNPVSLKQITGKDYNTIELARNLCVTIDEKYRELLQHGFEPIYVEYLDSLYKSGQELKFKCDNRVFKAILHSVSRTGKLIVRHNLQEEFSVGEVEMFF